VNFELDPLSLRIAATKLSEQCHGASKAAGWWNDPKTGTPTQANPMCFAQKLMLTVSELAEAMEGDRKALMDDKLPHRPMREVELADAAIRIFDLAGAFQLDIAGAIVEKMAFNQVRPDHQLAARTADGGKAY
jgi:NTP pyrophosphatase (non-canonical NTP hydrolase)